MLRADFFIELLKIDYQSSDENSKTQKLKNLKT